MTNTHRQPIHRPLNSIGDLIERYPDAPRWEAEGMLYAAGQYFTYHCRDIEVIEFLCRVGDNGNSSKGPWEGYQEARETARQVLVRRVLKTLGEYLFNYQSQLDSVIYAKLITFFGKGWSHCYLKNNSSDRKILVSFLSNCWNKWPDRKLYLRDLVNATIFMGCADLLPNEAAVRIQLYQHLCKEVALDGHTEFDVLDVTNDEVLKLCGTILAIESHALDDENRLASRLLQMQALTQVGS